MANLKEQRGSNCSTRRTILSGALAAGIVLRPLTATIGTAQGTAPTYTVLYNFTGGADGAYPLAGLITDGAGNLYGTTFQGGTTGSCFGPCGVVFKVDPLGNESVLYAFPGVPDGANPYGGLIRDGAGNLYGTTLYGGAYGAGAVFKLGPAGNETVLHSFTGGADGAYPNYERLIRDGSGNLYGTAQAGGNTSGLCGSYGCGVVFRLDPAGNETVLHTFTGGADGASPYAGLIRDGAGNLYSTTGYGGTSSACSTGYNNTCGVVFKLDHSGNESVLYAFTGGADGANPFAGLVRDGAGNLYGTTYYAGAYGAGVVFKLDPSGNETVLHTFTGGADGSEPWSGLIIDTSGNLYGTTAFGGIKPGIDGLGLVFKVDASGHETVLHTFDYANGGNPSGELIRDKAGSFYGTTITGGDVHGCFGLGCGVIFKLLPSGEAKVLHRFSGVGDGANPTHGLIRDAAGDLYGASENGGDPAACLNYEPYEAVTTGVAGCGVIFKLDPAGNETPLYTFGAAPDGSDPRATLIRDAAGNLYGTAFYGGSYGNGTVFKLDPAGHETVLYNFTGGTDGANPWGGLVWDTEGNLYGTANHAGGSCFCGTVFKLDAAGNYSVLHTFAGTDGQYPEAPLLFYKGALYGITSGGGTLSGGGSGTGTIFKITIP